MTVTPQGQAAARAYHTSGGTTEQRWDAAANAAIGAAHAKTPEQVGAIAGATARAVREFSAPNFPPEAAGSSAIAAAAMAQRDALRDRMTAVADALDASAAATAPSKKSEIEREAARRIRAGLEG